MSQGDQGILTDEIRSHIGRKGPVHTVRMDEQDLTRYAVSVAVDEPNPLYVDEGFAAGTVFGGRIVPFHFGTETEYIRPLRPGEVLTSQAEIVDIVEKKGRQGPLIITTTATTYRDEAGEPVVIVRSSLISR